MDKFTFIGALNYGKLPVCGETIKNQMFLNFFMHKYRDIIFFDTFNWRSSPLRLLRLLAHLLFTKDRKLIISIAPESAYKLSRILFFCPPKKAKYYFVVGGVFAERVLSKKYNVKYYKQYSRIFVQGKIMVKQLEGMGLGNVEYLPNCRSFDKSLLLGANSYCGVGEKLHFVFLSRIVEVKGVSFLLDTIGRLNKVGFQDYYDITFYGPIADGFEHYFRAFVDQIPNVEYGGFLNLQSNEGYRALSVYDMMIFPTFWEGEGFPGVIVDAFVSGLPVLASDWNLNSEVIENNVTGFLFKAQDHLQLFNAMKYVLQNKNVLIPMRGNCLRRARELHSDIVLNAISL